jgi:hypothetical protein
MPIVSTFMAGGETIPLNVAKTWEESTENE